MLVPPILNTVLFFCVCFCCPRPSPSPPGLPPALPHPSHPNFSSPQPLLFSLTTQPPQPQRNATKLPRRQSDPFQLPSKALTPHRPSRRRHPSMTLLDRTLPSSDPAWNGTLRCLFPFPYPFPVPFPAFELSPSSASSRHSPLTLVTSSHKILTTWNVTLLPTKTRAPRRPKSPLSRGVRVPFNLLFRFKTLLRLDERHPLTSRLGEELT